MQDKDKEIERLNSIISELVCALKAGRIFIDGEIREQIDEALSKV